ncbi:hypothetical protein KSP39_PZI014748 [Platanthera zijinensis]|uniref:Uncharacterized protein n=1 Tax=Platanthera zijinensis TaxID=2320716 RepID=A0AAP0BB54_9ASPA
MPATGLVALSVACRLPKGGDGLGRPRGRMPTAEGATGMAAHLAARRRTAWPPSRSHADSRRGGRHGRPLGRAPAAEGGRRGRAVTGSGVGRPTSCPGHSGHSRLGCGALFGRLQRVITKRKPSSHRYRSPSFLACLKEYFFTGLLLEDFLSELSLVPPT